MDDLEAFERSCRDTSMALRRIPKELRKAMSVRVKPEVAIPLAAKIASNAVGPWAAVLAKATKARASADPTIVVGGARKVVSGGASARALVYGVEFGSTGRTVTGVPAGRGHRSYSRKSTRQFLAHKQPFVFPTIKANGGWVLEQFATIADDDLTGELQHG